MPHVHEDAHLERKRRWSEDEERSIFADFAPAEQQKDFYVLNQRPDLTPRKILPLTKRARITDDDIHIHDLPPLSHQRRRSGQLRVVQIQSPADIKPRRTNGALLAPCHICHRKPTKKSDLDSFAECQGCGEQTCFVCIRECHGWNRDDGSVLSEQEVLSRSFQMHDVDDQEQSHKSQNEVEEMRKGWAAGGHRAVVCSRCCIERGAEGDVACLGCLSRMEGA